jgi:hypothetical protein
VIQDLAFGICDDQPGHTMLLFRGDRVYPLKPCPGNSLGTPGPLWRLHEVRRG